MSEQGQDYPVVPGTEGFVDPDRLQQREQNLARVRENMATAQKVNAGNSLREGVDIDHTTELGHYVGRVKFIRPDTYGYIRMGAHKAQLLQANFVDEHGNLQRVDPIYLDAPTIYAAQVLSTLNFVIVKDAETPEWIKEPGKQVDFDILVYVYERFTEWADSFRIVRDRKSTGDSEATGTEANVAG